MPTYLRRFYTKKLIDVKNEEKKEIENTNKNKSNPARLNIPKFKQ